VARRRALWKRHQGNVDASRLIFLPPYSPDLNPIEQVFAKLKTLLRKAAARTIEDTWKSIGNLLGEFSPEECANSSAPLGSSFKNPECHRRCAYPIARRLTT
jgi:transposase